MPYANLPEDGISIFYRTNLPGDGSALHLDRTRPTVLLLHGAILSSSELTEQFSDPRLARYNLIAPDAPSAGHTINSPNVARDGWTDAALLIKFLELLQLPSVHILACSGWSVDAALRIGLLWPERCLSMTLASVLVRKEEDWVLAAWREVCHTLTTAPNIETLEEGASAIIYYWFGDWLSDEQNDMVAMYLETQYPPARNSRFVDHTMMSYARVALTADELARIEVPVLILSADCPMCSPKEAAELRDLLTHASGGAKLHVFEGAPEQQCIIPYFARPIHSLFIDFLDHLPVSRRPQAPTGNPMQRALATLAATKGNPTMLQRDRHLSVSFSCVPVAAREERRAMFAHAVEIERTGFSPVGSLGEPPRRYSERHSHQNFPMTSPMCSPPDNWAAAVQVSVVQEH